MKIRTEHHGYKQQQKQLEPGADPAFLKRGTLVRIFLSDIRKLFKRAKFFFFPKNSSFFRVLRSATQFFIIKKN